MPLLPTNEIVARITGMNRKILTDSREGASSVVNDPSIGMSCPSPIETIRGRTEQPHEVRQRMYESSSRGDRADFQYDLPKSADSHKTKVPKHRMPETDADDIEGADDLDDEAQQVGTKQTEAKRSMSKFYNEYIGNMEEFRHYAGLPMTEQTIPEPRTGHSGVVPSAGVGKQNKLKAGLSGLEGTPLQDINPKNGPGDEDEVGDATYMTLDQAISMLKKEGIDTDDLWSEFLERRGLTTEIFDQLVDEALEGESEEEMDQLLAVEGIFMQELPRLLPEGLRDLFGLKQKAAPPNPLASVKAAGDKMRQHGVAAVRAANARGVDVKAPAPKPAAPKPAMKPTSIDQVSHELGQAQSVGFMRGARQRRPTERIPIQKAEGWNFEADHDNERGGPRMPWESNMRGLVGKYLSESKKSKKSNKRSKR